MGAITTPSLAAAVAAEGGLGMIAAAGLPADVVVGHVQSALESGGDGARVGVNFLMPFLDERALDAASAIASVVECFYGDPDPVIVDRIHDGGALAAWQIGSLGEACAAAAAGCDVIVVQGCEAGGHVRGTAAMLPLLNDVRATIGVPLVAAGGIGSGAAMASALLAGADAVRIGTRLVATTEADVHPDYAAALVAAGADDTVLTGVFSLGWPNAPHRVLRRCVEPSDLDAAPRSTLPPTRDFTGDVASAALYAGTSAADVTAVVPAATVIRELVDDAATALGIETVVP
jgi:NAD(P)H-dependent flavin oxidoreductase YrpB (nitropropane dioxygenase family)